MEPEGETLTLDMAPALRRRLRGVAALKGVTMRAYCQTAIDDALTRDESAGLVVTAAVEPDSVRFARLRQRYFGSKALSGSGADFVREAREARDAQLKDLM